MPATCFLIEMSSCGDTRYWHVGCYFDGGPVMRVGGVWVRLVLVCTECDEPCEANKNAYGWHLLCCFLWWLGVVVWEVVGMLLGVWGSTCVVSL